MSITAPEGKDLFRGLYDLVLRVPPERPCTGAVISGTKVAAGVRSTSEVAAALEDTRSAAGSQ
jgi:hypothetical protein